MDKTYSFLVRPIRGASPEFPETEIQAKEPTAANAEYRMRFNVPDDTLLSATLKQGLASLRAA